jgi:hypothetical protein
MSLPLFPGFFLKNIIVDFLVFSGRYRVASPEKQQM